MRNHRGSPNICHTCWKLSKLRLTAKFFEIALHVIKSSSSWGEPICTKMYFTTKTTFCKLCAQHLKSLMKRWILLTIWWQLENIILSLLFSNLQSWKSYWHSLKDTSNISRCTWSHVYCFFVSRQRNIWFLFFCSWFHAAGWPWSPAGREGALIISYWFVPCLESRKESVSFLASSLGSLDFGRWAQR